MRGGSDARSIVHGDLHRKTPWSKLRHANGRHTLVYNGLAPTTRTCIIASPDVHDLTPLPPASLPPHLGYATMRPHLDLR